MITDVLLPKYADANAVPNITTVHTVIKWLWQKLYQACEVNLKATELTSSPDYDPHAAWVALHRHFLSQDPITTMSRESRLSTLRQRPFETNSDFLNRFFEDLLIIEYTVFPSRSVGSHTSLSMHYPTPITVRMPQFSISIANSRPLITGEVYYIIAFHHPTPLYLSVSNTPI